MKKLYISFLFSSFFAFQAIVPNKFKQRFLNYAFHYQPFIDDKRVYLDIMEPYIDEALTQLTMARMCCDTHISASDNCNLYLDALIDYHEALFNKKFRGFKGSIEKKENFLKYCLARMGNSQKEEERYKQAEEEYRKTKKLLEKTNDAFYNQLPFSTRWLIFATKNLS